MATVVDTLALPTRAELQAAFDWAVSAGDGPVFFLVAAGRALSVESDVARCDRFSRFKVCVVPTNMETAPTARLAFYLGMARGAADYGIAGLIAEQLKDMRAGPIAFAYDMFASASRCRPLVLITGDRDVTPATVGLDVNSLTVVNVRTPHPHDLWSETDGEPDRPPEHTDSDE